MYKFTAGRIALMTFLLLASVAWAADNFVVKDGNGVEVTMGSKDLSDVHYPKHVPVDVAGVENVGAVGSTTCATDTGSCNVNAKLSRIAERITSLITSVTATAGTTITATVTRPADTNIYAADDVWATSTSAPTSGGSTLTAACGASGGNGMLTDMLVITSIAGVLQGEIWLFDSAVTEVNDNAAFALSDTDVAKLIGVVPFTVVANPSNSHQHVTGLNYGYTCVGSANLRYLVKVKSAYTPASAEVLTLRAKVLYVD
jgi:hypothetical protein